MRQHWCGAGQVFIETPPTPAVNELHWSLVMVSPWGLGLLFFTTTAALRKVNHHVFADSSVGPPPLHGPSNNNNNNNNLFMSDICDLFLQRCGRVYKVTKYRLINLSFNLRIPGNAALNVSFRVRNTYLNLLRSALQNKIPPRHQLSLTYCSLELIQYQIMWEWCSSSLCSASNEFQGRSFPRLCWLLFPTTRKD